MMNQATNFIIWNVRGANNINFRRNFREIMNTHRPCLVALLETKLASYTSISEEFDFTEMIEVPDIGKTCGLVILWNHNMVTVNNFKKSG